MFLDIICNFTNLKESYKFLFSVEGVCVGIFSEPVIVEEVSSTQDWVKKSDFPQFKPFIAKRQTKGRGRRGKRWFSPPGGGLYLSFKLPKEFFVEGRELSRLSLVFGLSVSQAVDTYTLSKIKWPNDVYIGEKKVAGILIETNSTDLVVGIGVNLNMDGFPPELKEGATSIYLATQNRVDFYEFTTLLLNYLSENILRFRSEGFKPFVPAINRKLLWKGKRVVVDQRECGRLLGINEKGLAVIKTCFGALKTFPYGDISLRRG
ncbi:MAG TPA: biotin--[acetyl-CoA-carboxylase] ligase [Aquifex aeolicus]|nr:biotin--[acetyl-CoA-carboxylase] ligase [Aquificales bacterium]HIQ25904.1 biotin--[acetyl-CoA-carboxylase] ligase [Aquifex aeolicus]